ncbi:tigger transposable element-derived protein 1-like [Palaemon carinicauda]|uniref:tigger transposable element-derived protein 1-like n=1 Tax=Palaemon carinicauda TaxID=392227 RepID=UPI0035B68675
MPRTFITAEEKRLPGHKSMKDQLTLALCANASGDCKVKPLLVYHSENARAFKSQRILKEKLQVMWRANAKAWVTQHFFTEWVNMCFGLAGKKYGPAAKKYLAERNLPLKCLLVLDNGPGHPSGLEEDILDEFRFIKVLYLPPNTTPLLQPIDQQVISNFEKLYMKHLFKKCFDVTDNTNLTLREFWKEHFIVHCLKIIDDAWLDVTRCTLNSAWKKLWPASVAERDFEGFDTTDPDDPEPVVMDEIVSLGKSMGLEELSSEEVVEDEGRLSTAEIKDVSEVVGVF